MTESGSDPDPLPAERLAYLTAERPAAVHHARHSRLVRILRLLLPVAALAIVAVVIAWPKMDQFKPSPAAQQASQRPVTHNELIQPRFMGQDSQNQPYSLTANRAVQAANDPDLLLLDHPNGQALLSDGTKVEAQANQGAYRQKTQNLVLEGSVHIANSTGYAMDGSRLTIDLASRRATSDQPVTGDGPAGTIRATGLQADRETGALIFTGPATLVLKNAVQGLQ